jgi:hypothetical protein
MVQEMKKTFKDKKTHTICYGLLDTCAHYHILEKLACMLDPHANLQRNSTGFKELEVLRVKGYMLTICGLCLRVWRVV